VLVGGDFQGRVAAGDERDGDRGGAAEDRLGVRSTADAAIEAAQQQGDGDTCAEADDEAEGAPRGAALGRAEASGARGHWSTSLLQR
jgi:hypothetical protein